MIAYSIVIRNDPISETGYDRLVASSEHVGNNFTIQKFEAITPPYVDDTMKKNALKWNYPTQGKIIDFASGLEKSAYQTRDLKKRIACALSHYMLWLTAINLKQSILVLEHDAMFSNSIDFEIEKTPFQILGINNPLGCTRKSKEYYDNIVNTPSPYQPVPWIDEQKIPQGLAGNSAYIISPQGAEQLKKLVKEYGLWPNDAIMCKQLVRRLGVTKKFYTTIQNLRSTTTT